MKTAAVIAEYNPFHEGHKYLIEETKKKSGADFVLVLMSGDFVQRGEPAVFNKYRRTQMALEGGADAVLELPSLYAVSSAEYFAGGAVTLLNQLGIADYLAFGSESGDIELIKKCAKLSLNDSSEYQESLSSLLRQGLSYPVARNQAILNTACPFAAKKGTSDTHPFPSPETVNTLFCSPNNILAIEYCKSLFATNSTILPVTVKRQGAGYHDIALSEETGIFPSSSAIRNAMEYGNTNMEFLTPNDFSSLLHYKLLSEYERGYGDYLDCTSDFSNKIKKYLPLFTDFESFCTLLKSKNITYTRISRILTHILLGIKTPESYKHPLKKRSLYTPYARLLGFRKSSSELLSSIKQNSSIPLISKLADAHTLLDENALSMLNQDILSGTIYESVFQQKYQKGLLNEYKQSPIII